MGFLDNIALGLGEAITTTNLLYCFLGCLMGTLIGVLPGLGPAATIIMLMPLTFALDPTTSLIMLAGIYYGAQYGGSTTAILVNIPGEASSTVTAIDGYQMARKGQAGLALSTAAISSFIAGTIATLVIAVFAPVLAGVALRFGPTEYFALMVLGLVCSVVLASGSLVKALAMVTLGLTAGVVGIDVTSGVERFTFGFQPLSNGLDMVPVAMGVFGLGEIISNLSRPAEQRTTYAGRIGNMLPSRKELRRMLPPALRGTTLGSVLGVLPGGGALLASFATYAMEKRLARDPKSFGKGALEGVAGPEAANNAGAQTSFIPMLTLGIPSTVIMALMAGAMMIQGIQPGPSVIREQPDLFWGLIASMWVGNLMLVILNLPLVGVWVKLLTIPYRILFPAILIFCAIGVIAINGRPFDIYIMVVFGLVGALFRRLDCEPAPFILGMVIGPLVEEYLRRAMLLSRGDPMIFLTRPISAVLLALTVGLILMIALPSLRKRRDEALQEDGV